MELALLGHKRDAGNAVHDLETAFERLPRAVLRAWQIELHRAAGEANARHAVAILAALSDPQRSDQFIRRLGVRTLAVCERENVAGVAELRDVLSGA